MMDTRAEYTYQAVLFAMLALVIWAGVIDLTMYVHGDPTISAWLRANPRWYVYPLAATLTFIGLLTIHLFA